MTETRKCCSCGKDKAIEAFRRSRVPPHERHPYCRACYAAAWQLKNRKWSNKAAAKWRSKQPDGALAAATKATRDLDRERHQREDREHYAENRENILARKKITNRAAYHKDVDATRAKRRALYAVRKAYYKSLVHAYRARKAGFAGRYSDDVIAAILLLQKGKCAYCKKDIRKSFDVDHITAITKGGANTGRNLQLTCAKCNRSKGNKDPITFAQSLGMLL